MHWFKRSWRKLLGIIVGLLAMGVIWFLTTDSVTIWPIRNTLRYQFDQWRDASQSVSHQPADRSISGCIRDAHQQPIVGAIVAVSERNGKLHRANSNSQGCYTLANLPANNYQLLVTAPSYRDDVSAVNLHNGSIEHDLQLVPAIAPSYAPVEKLQIGSTSVVSRTMPYPTQALRQQVQVWGDNGEQQLTLLYRPITATNPLPLMLAVYPGPADEWESVSIPLAERGYSVLAVGPAYSLDLEADIADLKRLLALARGGSFAGVDGGRVAIMAGSYSSLHVLRLLQDDVGFTGVVLLGPISDLFAMRENFVAGTFMPPFGLDQALIALGYPDEQIQRYATYSAQLHPRADLPPILLLHSRTDEVVPASQSEFLAAQWRGVGVEVESYFFAGMSHYLQAVDRSPELDELYRITLDFLARVN
ncbi:carboxypeptidase regulatory-like domain-containing protein [Herpetosiphon sp. NSE202]|uniref:carboxypeptidase regulatory-like domain-containing protein n=1 Tax=Herpetosiphon sp. NSE202 TaxID=3351349 RepID=UPI0036392B50